MKKNYFFYSVEITLVTIKDEIIIIVAKCLILICERIIKLKNK